jgi:hypothetical protein
MGRAATARRRGGRRCRARRVRRGAAARSSTSALPRRRHRVDGRRCPPAGARTDFSAPPGCWPRGRAPRPVRRRTRGQASPPARCRSSSPPAAWKRSTARRRRRPIPRRARARGTMARESPIPGPCVPRLPLPSRLSTTLDRRVPTQSATDRRGRTRAGRGRHLRRRSWSPMRAVRGDKEGKAMQAARGVPAARKQAWDRGTAAVRFDRACW